MGMRRKMRVCRGVERGNGADGVGELEKFGFNVGMEFGRVGVGLEKGAVEHRVVATEVEQKAKEIGIVTWRGEYPHLTRECRA